MTWWGVYRPVLRAGRVVKAQHRENWLRYRRDLNEANAAMFDWVRGYVRDKQLAHSRR